jgi:hypothetical protein
MNQVSAKLRRAADRYLHWCPACEEMHPLPDAGWRFNGDLAAPTFIPSFQHSGVKRIMVDGKWAGKWERGADGKPLEWICHYILTAGVLHFCGDHAMRGQSVPLPDLPAEVSDG